MSTLTADAALAGAAGRHSLCCPGSSIEDIATQLVGLHNTSPVSPYLSLRARLPGFTRSDLDELMWGSWRLARFRAMRMTMFIFPGDLIEIAAAATRHLAEPLAARWLRDSNLSQRRFDELAAAVYVALAEGPLTVRALRDALDLPVSINLSGIVGRMCDGRATGRRSSSPELAIERSRVPPLGGCPWGRGSRPLGGGSRHPGTGVSIHLRIRPGHGCRHFLVDGVHQSAFPSSPGSSP